MSALYSRQPCLGRANWFVSYKPIIVPQGNIMILPVVQLEACIGDKLVKQGSLEYNAPHLGCINYNILYH